MPEKHDIYTLSEASTSVSWSDRRILADARYVLETVLREDHEVSAYADRYQVDDDRSKLDALICAAGRLLRVTVVREQGDAESSSGSQAEAVVRECVPVGSTGMRTRFEVGGDPAGTGEREARTLSMEIFLPGPLRIDADEEYWRWNASSVREEVGPLELIQQWRAALGSVAAGRDR